MVDAFHFGSKFNNFSGDDHICIQNNLHTIWKTLTSIALLMVVEDVSNMDEIGLFILPNQTRYNARKSSWVQNSKRPSDSRSCCKHDMHKQVETYDNL